jgi:DNA-binding transcriptional MerR regulator
MSTARASARTRGRVAARRPLADVRAARERLAAHRDDATGELFGIAELGAEFGISTRAIRFYESKGLLSPRRINGVRIYTRRDRARLALIRRAKSIGFALAEIRRYLDLYGAHGEGRLQQLRFVLQKTDAAIAELEQRRAQVDATLAELRLINDAVRSHLATRA